MEVFNGLRRSQRSHFQKTTAKLDETELTHPCADDCKCARPLDVNDDLQFMCTKKCIPCHRCGSSMKFFMRRVKYLNTVKEYPAYRCMKKKCQTFRSPRTLARECNMLLRQRQTGGDCKISSVAPSTNATRQLKEAFPDHFGPSGTNDGSANDFKPDDFDSPAERCRSPVLLANREKEAWFAMNCAKNSLTTLLYNGSSLSQRLKAIVDEIHAIVSHFTPSNPSPTRTSIPDAIDFDDDGYDSSLSLRHSANLDTPILSVGDSRSSFENEGRSETSSIDMNQANGLTSMMSPAQPWSWINVSRHSPSFCVKFVDGSKRPVTPVMTNTSEPTSTDLLTLKAFSELDGIPEVAMPTHETITSSYDQQLTSYGYMNDYQPIQEWPQQSFYTTNVQCTEGSNDGAIYMRPNEVCFDDLCDMGGSQILHEFFEPSTLSQYGMGTVMPHGTITKEEPMNEAVQTLATTTFLT